MSPFTLQAADRIAPADLHAAFAAAFADYLLGPFGLPFEQWAYFLLRQGVELKHSRVALTQDGIVALALVAPHGKRWRLASMGAIPSARGSGAAPALLADMAARARADGRSALALETFAQNPRAVRLYQKHGFVIRHTLHGYTRAPGASEASAVPAAPVERERALAWLKDAEAGIGELALQVCAPVIQALATDWQAWQRGSAQLVFSVNGGTVTLHSLIDGTPNQHDAQALLRQLAAALPAQAWDVPQLQRADLGGEALLAAGCERKALYQYWMECPL
ncbi:GNAT family N-acetyltransferase [Paludibacterium purpuratum]|uniref:Ribosomal protein S18 acetylase RimI-like enzyme n=1 Tax=Paludibacterium purpuratum TaxID=1144873 RepID=A0A4R7BGM1_9NEIS|nr:GNAT family N-acetyltransferase [Paludibacterium purpuratum]TDR82876.1 ribosomal protein S18 acetylase RimI-like enzyme [Paludibacterium purpuratum]